MLIFLKECKFWAKIGAGQSYQDGSSIYMSNGRDAIWMVDERMAKSQSQRKRRWSILKKLYYILNAIKVIIINVIMKWSSFFKWFFVKKFQNIKK